MGISREQFLSKKDVPTKSVEIDGETMRVRGLTGAERTRWERESAKDPDGARGRLVALATIQDDGAAYFKANDAAAINDLPCAYIEPLVDAIFELSGMTAEARERVGKASAPAAGSETPTS